MSKKTFAIVSGIVGAVTICANTIISLFDIPCETAICDAVQAGGYFVIAVCACFMNPETKLINKK